MHGYTMKYACVLTLRVHAYVEIIVKPFLRHCSNDQENEVKFIFVEDEC